MGTEKALRDAVQGRIVVCVSFLSRKEKIMPYTIACADAGMSCPASFTTESKDELFEHVMMHGEKKHPELASNPDTGAQLEQIMRVS